jgi:hypothetical protein
MSRFLLLVGLFAPMTATASPLSSTVTHMNADDSVAFAPTSSGKTPEERYDRALTGPRDVVPGGSSIVAIVRLPEMSCGSIVTVTAADFDAAASGHGGVDSLGDNIVVSLEISHLSVPASKCVQWTPLVEVALGVLPRGAYTLAVHEHETFDHDPKTAKTHTISGAVNVQ